MSLNNKTRFCFAGGESAVCASAFLANRVKNVLFSAYPLLCDQINRRPIVIGQRYYRYERPDYIKVLPKFIDSEFEFKIMDSGVFTFMRTENKPSVKDIYKWQDLLVSYINDYVPSSVNVVEVDVQSILGQDVAWDLRRRFKNQVCNHKIINVFHLCDGLENLEKLIETSDYIAFSIPEFQSVISNNGPSSNKVKRLICILCKMAKKCKPSIKIHLLGTTNFVYLREVGDLVDSCDSTSFTGIFRFSAKRNKFKHFIQNLDVNINDSAEILNYAKHLLEVSKMNKKDIIYLEKTMLAVSFYKSLYKTEFPKNN